MTGRVPVGGRWISQRLSGSAGIPSVMGDIGMNGIELIDSLDFESAVNSRNLCWTGIPSACGKMKTYHLNKATSCTLQEESWMRQGRNDIMTLNS